MGTRELNQSDKPRSVFPKFRFNTSNITFFENFVKKNPRNKFYQLLMIMKILEDREEMNICFQGQFRLFTSLINIFRLNYITVHNF